MRANGILIFMNMTQRSLILYFLLQHTHTESSNKDPTAKHNAMGYKGNVPCACTLLLPHKHTNPVLMHTHMHNTHAGYADPTKHMKGAMKYNKPVEGILQSTLGIKL